jgi:hypothetical protein
MDSERSDRESVKRFVESKPLRRQIRALGGIYNSANRVQDATDDDQGDGRHSGAIDETWQKEDRNPPD